MAKDKRRSLTGSAAGTPSKTSAPGGNAPSQQKSKQKQKQTPKLYSNFLPIPLALPSPFSSSSSSSKSHPTTHYLYVRPHTSKPSSSSSSSDSLPSDRTLFVANLPVDITERELRVLFGKWGVVEDIRLSGQGSGDILEQAVLGTLEDEDEEESEGGSDDAEELEGGGGEEEEGRPEPTILPDNPVSRTKRRRRKPTLPPSVPTITPLPPLNPRSTPYFPSGAGTAHIIYLDALSLSRLMSTSFSSSSALVLPSLPADKNPTGLAYYSALHTALRPPLAAVKDHADSAMARYDHLHGMLLSSRARANGAGAIVDEDGFTVVVRSGRYGRTGGRGDGVGALGVGVAKRVVPDASKKAKKPGKGAGELTDFYRFQKVDRKRQELAGLRAQFEEDKKKVEEMRKARRFKPY